MLHPDDLLILKEVLWPRVTLYDKQIEIVESTLLYPETYVVAGNKLGKDFIAGFIAVSAFVACQVKGITCKILTTSVKDEHMDVVWGEIARFLTTSSQPLLMKDGGGLHVTHQELRRAEEIHAGVNALNYLKGQVSAKGEGLAGHHATWTLIIGDESSGLDDTVYKMAQGWAKHMLWIGNPNPCANFFNRGVEAGSLVA